MFVPYELWTNPIRSGNAAAADLEEAVDVEMGVCVVALAGTKLERPSWPNLNPTSTAKRVYAGGASTCKYSSDARRYVCRTALKMDNEVER